LGYPPGVRSLVFAFLLVACSGHGNPTKPPGPTAPTTAQFPAGPPLATPGERMSYRVQLQGVELAAMTLGVGDVTDVGGKKAIVVQGHAKAVGLAGMVASIDDTFTSWIDVETGRSLRFQADEFATNSKTDVEHVVADLAGRTTDSVPVTFGVNDGPPSPEPQKVSLPEVWDYNTFVIALRSWEGTPGTKTTVDVFRSRYLWRVVMTIRGKDKLATALGDFPALRFDGHAYKLDRSGGKYPNSDERNFSVWVSDDDGRVPLQIRARTDYGDVKMEIVDYQPGTGQRLRR
jgi:hypothetical protein